MYLNPRSPIPVSMCGTRAAQKCIWELGAAIQVSRLPALAQMRQDMVGTGCLKLQVCLLGSVWIGCRQRRMACCFGMPCPSPRLTLLLKPSQSCSAQTMHIRFTLSHAWPKMGWIPKETYATKSSCLFSLGDKYLTMAQATGIKQTQILSRESLAAPTFCLELAGASWQSKHSC